MNCTYYTDPETGRTVYGQRRKQPAGLATFQARKAAQEAAALAPYSVEKESIYSSAPWIVKYDGKAIGEFFPTKKAAVAWIEQKKQEKAPAQEQAETPENHSETKKPDEKKEEKTMKKVEFTPAAIIVNGQEYAARYEYGETPKNHYLPTIRVFTELSGNACIVELPDDDPEYNNARAAMEQEKPDETPAQEQAAAPAQEEQQPDETPENHSEQEEQPAQEQAAPAQEEAAASDPVAELRKYDPEKAEKYAKLIEKAAAQEEKQPDETPAQEEQLEQADETPENHSEKEEQPARDPKQARGPVPEKTFVGTSIKGAGYSIIFDGACNRTRVVVSDDVKEKARPIIEKAGFYYSAAMDSWNKKLTFRAYRAAQELAAELKKALAA